MYKKSTEACVGCYSGYSRVIWIKLNLHLLAVFEQELTDDQISFFAVVGNTTQIIIRCFRLCAVSSGSMND